MGKCFKYIHVSLISVMLVATFPARASRINTLETLILDTSPMLTLKETPEMMSTASDVTEDMPALLMPLSPLETLSKSSSFTQVSAASTEDDAEPDTQASVSTDLKSLESKDAVVMENKNTVSAQASSSNQAPSVNKDSMPAGTQLPSSTMPTGTQPVSFPTPASDTNPAVKITSPTTFILPINVLNNAKQKVNLTVRIPDSFKALGNYATDLNPSELMEFIPKDDKDPENWTQIITVKSYPGIALKSNKDFLDEIVSGFKAHALKTNVIDSDDKKKVSYEEGYRIIAYTYNNRDEVVYIYSASGPADTAMVQYAIKLNAPADLDKVKEQLKEFMKTNVIKDQ